MPALAEDLAKTLQDAVYVTVGLGLIAFQKAQVQRQELLSQLGAVKTHLDRSVRRATER